MLVGTLVLDIRLDESYSIKDKRRVRKSVVERIRRRWNVSIAEVDSQEVWNLLTVGLAFVSNERKPIERALDQIVTFLEEVYFLEVMVREREVF